MRSTLEVYKELVMTVSSVSNVDIGALQNASVGTLVGKLSASYDKLAAQAPATYDKLAGQADTYSAKLSTLGQIQSGFSTVQTKATTLQDSATLSTNSGARTALQDVLDTLNAQASLVAGLTQSGSDSQSAGILAKESGLSGSAEKVRQAVGVNGLYGQTVLQGMGITQSSDGTLSLDAAAFDQAYQANSSKVTNALTQIGSNVATEAATQISSGSAYSKSQAKTQGLYDNVVKQQDALQTRLNNLQTRIENLQSGGVTAAAVQDYSTITSVATSAATRINALQKQGSSLAMQIDSANTKLGDLGSVSDSLYGNFSSAQALQDSATLSSVGTAGAALQNLVTALNYHSTLLNTLTAPVSGSTPAGSLKNETSLVTGLKSLGQAAASNSLYSQISISIGMTQTAGGLFSFDLSAFNSAYASNASSVINTLRQLGSAVQTAAGNQLAEGGALDKVTSKTNALIPSLQTRQSKLEEQIAALQNDPFSAVPASSYQKILAM